MDNNYVYLIQDPNLEIMAKIIEIYNVRLRDPKVAEAYWNFLYSESEFFSQDYLYHYYWNFTHPKICAAAIIEPNNIHYFDLYNYVCPRDWKIPRYPPDVIINNKLYSEANNPSGYNAEKVLNKAMSKLGHLAEKMFPKKPWYTFDESTQGGTFG